MTNCIWCGKPTDERYIIADDLENPQPYHKVCVMEMVFASWEIEHRRKKK
jgi:hypothetical protein